MSRMAAMGRGTYTHVGTPQEVAARMMPLLDLLRHPAMQNLRVRVEGGSLDLTPRDLPDLYAGQPLVLLGRTQRLSGTLTVSGEMGGQPWERRIDLSKAQESPAIARLWARRRIDVIETDRATGKLDDKAADDAITELGLTSGIVTAQTSLVAIDETPTRPAGQGLTREDLPLNLPAGWDFDTLFGGESGKAALANADTLGERAAQQAHRLDLPQTATGFAATIVQGCALLLAGLAMLLRRKGARA
jgi:Ca-activated chloride channel family protein